MDEMYEEHCWLVDLLSVPFEVEILTDLICEK
jgi:hypothetical protein